MPRRDQAGYAELLREHDVGLALMYTPHPSLAPIEMAAAGMLTVTNTFETKTADALAAISPNLVAVEPTLESVVAGLSEAVGRGGRRRAARARRRGALEPRLGRVIRRSADGPGGGIPARLSVAAAAAPRPSSRPTAISAMAATLITPPAMTLVGR